jgi:hypothetical protein
MLAGALALAGVWGGLAALAILAPLAAAAVLAALGLVVVLGVLALAAVAFLGPRGGHGGGRLAELPRLPDAGRYAPPRNPDRPAAAYESYTIPRHDPRLREWE